jgi:hypothetical protein
LGFPFKNSPRNDVYLGVNGEEKGRISYSKANNYLTESILRLLPLHRIKGVNFNQNRLTFSGKLGFCKKCNKKLRGNILKPVCSLCWNDLGKPSIDAIENILSLKQTYIDTFALLNSGQSIDQISKNRQLSKSTIFKHIEVISEFIDVKQYETIKPSKVILDSVKKAINTLGHESKLKEIYEFLNEKIHFDEIKHALLFMNFKH